MPYRLTGTVNLSPCPEASSRNSLVDVVVRAVGFDDLIALNRGAARDRDLEDVATLLAARRPEPGEN